ncbi:heme NO-binding protein [Rhodophyticola sp. CCM32]|uniref:heme NO-binding domain-containing protein n=1 Tax=Rhodophyticola sp. CCM32 TaxID=2916397 RepID=UPI00107F7F8E|nr:heme NO-binding domain-containing protein [Rhodophyticola sp. CCM32]QBY01408.1 heme NO-binding protein [Rhodophyticola sp. CCM32]
MHGLVNRALQEFLKDTYGPETWTEVRNQAGLPFEEFESMLHYEVRLTLKLVAATCFVLQKEAAVILEDIGIWLVSTPEREPVRRLLRFGGATFLEFLQSLEELPGRARMALPDLDMPEIALHADGPRRFILETKWALPGIGSVLLGTLRVMADDYGALVLLDSEIGENGRETLVIELLETQFSAGQAFELGTRVS